MIAIGFLICALTTIWIRVNDLATGREATAQGVAMAVGVLFLIAGITKWLWINA